MGLLRQRTRLLILLTAISLLASWRPVAAQQPDLLGGEVLAEVYSPWSATRVSDARWYGSVDALMLMRDSTPNRAIASQTSPNRFVLGTGDLDAGFQAGPCVTLGRRLGMNHQFEITWFDLTDWSDLAAIRDQTTNALGGSGDLFSPFTNFGNPAVVGLDYNNLASIEYYSELDSLEMNLRHRIAMPPGPLGVTLLVGGRYMRIREGFGYHTESSTPVGSTYANDVQVATGNELLGIQLGALLEFQVDYRSQITLDLKGGIFNNAADQATVYNYTTSLGTQTYTGSRAEDITAWVGELNLSLAYQIAPRLTGHVGYQMIWVEGIAQASENFVADAAILAAGPADLNRDGHAIYHGPHVGLILRL